MSFIVLRPVPLMATKRAESLTPTATRLLRRWGKAIVVLLIMSMMYLILPPLDRPWLTSRQQTLTAQRGRGSRWRVGHSRFPTSSAKVPLRLEALSSAVSATCFLEETSIPLKPSGPEASTGHTLFVQRI
jgi:hypothetical protein